MRTQGKGQQFDKLWAKANELIDESLVSAENSTLDKICELKAQVEAKQPKSDYEVKDKANLIDLLSKAFIRVLNNQYDDYVKENYKSFVGAKL